MSLLLTAAVSMSTIMPLSLLGALHRPVLAILGIVVCLAALLVGCVFLLVSRFKRCPPNRALVIFGRTGPHGSTTRVIHGGAAFVMPLLQDFGYLKLEPTQVDVPGLPTPDVTGFNFELPSLCSVAIGTDEESLHTAAVRLLGQTDDEIRDIVRPIIHTQVVNLVETKRAQGTETTQSSFANELKPAIEKQLDQFGLQVINIGQMVSAGAVRSPASDG